MRPRRHSFCGEVCADGLWIRRDVKGRVLSLWGPGMRVHEVGEGYALIFAAPRPMRVDRAWGTPLVSLAGRLCSAPLEPDERTGPMGALYLVQGGEIQILDPGEPIDPSEWLDLGADVTQVRALTDPPPAPDAPPPPPPNGRALFSDLVGEEPEELRSLLKGMDPHSAMGGGRAWLNRQLGAVLRTAVNVGRRFGRRARTGGQQSGPGGPSGANDGWIHRLDRWVAARMAGLGLSGLMNRVHARYVRDLLRRMDSDEDLAEALRRAIPLDGPGGLQQSLGSLRAPSPLDQLTFSSAAAAQQRHSIAMGDQVLSLLRERYQTMRRRLEAQGRIDEAAYVLAELLGQPLEAVHLLEQHERWAKAAELAAIKELDPSLVVRIQFQAGDIAGAVKTARLRGGMAGALTRLQSRDATAARQLRLVWAATLASQGRYGAAVELLLAHKPELGVSDDWVEHAIEGGGPLGAKALVRALQRDPDDWRRRYAQAEAWLDSDSRDTISQLAGAVAAFRAHPVLTPLARRLVRALAAHPVARGPGEMRGDALQRLRRWLGGGLAVDVPHRTPRLRTPLDARIVPVAYAVAGRDRGMTRILDARWLPSERLLVALGEAGMALYNRDGRLLRRWEHVAHRLAVHQEGGLAIGIAHRGTIQRLCRLELATGKATPWGDAEFVDMAPEFGESWMVVRDREVLAIDPIAPSLKSLWRVDFKQPVSGLSVGTEQFSFVADDELWIYRLPSLRLHRRKPFQVEQVLGQTGPQHRANWTLTPEGRLWGLTRTGDQPWESVTERGGEDLQLPLGDVAQLQATPTWAAVSLGEHLCLIHEGMIRLSVQLTGGTPRFRLNPHTLSVWDEHGRVLVIDALDGRLRAEMRL